MGRASKEICRESRVERPISRREKEWLQLFISKKNWEIRSFWEKEAFGRVSLQYDK
jgi:hypothetical protein